MANGGTRWSIDDLNDLVASYVLIARGHARKPSDQERGGMTIVEWVKSRDEISPAHFAQVVAEVAAMSPSERGKWIKSADFRRPH